MQTNPVVTQEEQHDDIDLLGLVGPLIDHKWLIGGVTAAFMVLSIAYSLLATPIYKANAMIQVEKKSSGLAGLSEMADVLGKESKAVTEIELIKSRTVIGKAVDQLQLDLMVRPHYFPIIGRTMARRFSPRTPNELASPMLGTGSYAWGGERLQIKDLQLPDELMGTQLTLTTGESGSFALYDEDGQELMRGQTGAEAASNGVRIRISELHARPGTDFTVQRLKRLNTILEYQNQLQVTERGKDSGILNLSLDGPIPEKIAQVLDEISRQFVRQNIERTSAEAASSLEFLREQLPNVRADLEKSENALNTFQRQAKSVDVSGETQAVLQQSVAIETKLTELKFQQAEIDRKFTRQHPTYQALLRQIDEVSRKQGEISGNIRKLPETQQEILRLTRDLKVGTEIYTQLLNKVQELDVVRAGTVGNARIIDNAAVDVRSPVAPKKSLIVVIATLFGALLASAFVLARRALNRGIESPEEIEKLGLPVYATVPLSEQQGNFEARFKEGKSKGEAIPLLSAAHPHDLAVEALRSLRTSLHFAMLEATNNRIMISGPSPGVGKSFVSSNLAAIIAQAGQRVLLVDADLRKGHLHKMFAIDEDNGLSNLLARDTSFEQAVHSTSTPGLSVVARGKIPPNPSELLMHPNFGAFLEQASAAFDLVIVDTPPLLAVTDAAIVGRLAGTTLIVTRFGVNPAREVDLTVRRFAQNGIEVKGAIFNGMEKRATGYGGYGKYGGYGYYQYEYKPDKS
ncbi:MAG: wzc [Proteobacteria bacterium]|nr:wzc [Pseudomonadota bacterium]